MAKFERGNSRAAKLTNDQVYDIRAKYWNENWSQVKLARTYGVVPETIGRIVRGDSRKNIATPIEVAPDAAVESLRKVLAMLEADKPKSVVIGDVVLEDSPGARRLQREAQRSPEIRAERDLNELLKGGSNERDDSDDQG